MENNSENKYICKYCGELFFNKGLFANHIQHKHFKKKYICQYCNIEFLNKSSYTRHVNAVHFHKLSKQNKGGCFQKVKCEKCGNYFLKPNFQRHFLKCCTIIEHKNNNFDIIDNKYICKACGKSFNKFGIKAHIFRVHSKERFEFNNKLRHSHKGSSLKGKTFDEVFGKERSLEIRQKISDSLKGKSHRQTEETRNKISLGMKKIKAGGLRIGSGRGKKGYYKGVYCDSTYELIFLIYCLDHNIKIERCKENRKYFWNNKWRKYYPDFVVNNEIVEIKGFYSDQFKYKILYNSDIKVLFKKDIQYCFDYVDNKYFNIIGKNKDYIKLYDKKED